MKIIDELVKLLLFLIIFPNKNHPVGKKGEAFPRFLTYLIGRDNHWALPCILIRLILPTSYPSFP